MKAPSSGYVSQPVDGERRSINSELWHACAGPLVSLPPVGSLVVYFPQGHLEQVAASMQKESEGQIPNYQNLPSKLICQLHNVTLHADVETDQVYAQMTLQPVNTADKDALLASDLGLKQSKQPTEFFCKTLTASDTSTHGGFSVPRRSAEKFFPPLDFSMQPPAQELVARDLHDNVWTFRHIYRGQPKRHLLTTGWSVFVSAKRLLAGDSVLFIRDEKSQLLLGIRRANRQQAPMLSSVLSSDSMHIGVLAAAAHAASNHSPFTVFYNPRASCSEFVIPWSKYNKALYGTQISLGMRFRMMFETEESGVRRYMGTITGRSELDPVRWPNSEWRNIQVGWDESSVGERQNRVSIWEIEPVATPFFICPPPFFRPKRPHQPGMLGEESDLESTIKRTLPWFGEEISIGNSPNSTIPGIGLVEWMTMQQKPEIISSTIQPEYYRPMAAATLQKLGSNETSKPLSSPQQALQPHQMQFGAPQSQHSQQQEHLQQPQILVPQQHHSHNPQQQQQNLHTQQQMLLQKVEPQHLQAQQQISSLQVEQQQVLSQKVNLQHQSLHHLQQQPAQQLHQQLQQLQQQPHPQSTLPLPQLAQQQQQQQRLQQLQQPLAQLQQQDQRLQQPPQQVQQPPRQVQQQQQLLQSSQQFHQHQIQTLPPSQQHMPNQILQHLHNQQKQHLQQSIQLPEIQGQLLQSSSSQSQAPVNMPLAPKAQSVFTDVASCSTSISANSYPLQNVLSRTNQCASTSEERTQYANMPRPNPSGAQAAMPVSNLVLEPPVTSWFPSIKEPNQVAVPTYLSGQLGQMETSSSSGASFSLSQTDAIGPQSFPLLPIQSSPFLFSDVSHDTDIQTEARNNFLFGVNIENPLIVPSTSSPLLTSSLSAGKDSQNHVSAGNVLPSFTSGKDVQPQISSPPGSQSFAVSDLPFNPGVASDGGMHDSNFLQRGSWQQPLPTMRTYTKVYKLGSVGRSIDVTRCKNYHELRCELARMFGLEGQLEDPQRSAWQLVFVDNECDVLLVGDDPWEEFVSCVRCIRILSPNEVLQMGQENMEPLNTIPLQQQTGSSSDGGIVWRDSCDQNSTNPSAGSLEH